MSSERSLESRTGGRAATTGVIPGDSAISVGNPQTPLPAGWRWRLLTDIARLETGHTPSRRHPEYWGGDVPWIGIRDATGNHGATIFETAQYTNALGIRHSSARILPTHTVCLSRTASVGYVVVMGAPMATSQDFVNWVCGPDLDYRYLKYVLLAERDSFLRFASGTTHQTIYFPEVKAFHIALPLLSIQKGIADVLSAFDDRITLLRETNATLEAIAQALFKSWFVDFDPVRANIAAKSAPEGAVQGGTSAAQGTTAGMPEAGQRREPLPTMPAPALDAAATALFPDSFEESELGLVPKGWRVGSLGDIASIKGGKQLEKEFFEDRGLNPIFGGAGVMGHTDLKNAEGFVIAVGRVGAYCGQFFWHLGEAWVNNNASHIQPMRNLDAVWIYQWLRATNIDHIKKGAAQPFVSNGDIAELKLALPKDELVGRFVEVIGPVYEQMASLQAKAHTLTQLRDTLLPRLISGQLRLPEAESLLETIP